MIMVWHWESVPHRQSCAAHHHRHHQRGAISMLAVSSAGRRAHCLARVPVPGLAPPSRLGFGHLSWDAAPRFSTVLVCVGLLVCVGALLVQTKSTTFTSPARTPASAVVNDSWNPRPAYTALCARMLRGWGWQNVTRKGPAKNVFNI